MKHPCTATSDRHPTRRQLVIAIASLLLMVTALLLQAHAQGMTPAAPATTASAGPLQVGDATRSLLEKQRSGTLAADTPRPITGEVAQRSYERYLRSFERPIPENFNSVASPAGKGSK